MATMKTVTRFDRSNIDLISGTVMSMLQAFAKQAGLEVTRESGRFSQNTFTMKISFRVLAQDGSGKPVDFAAKALRAGVAADSWGKVFAHGGKTYTVTDVKPRNRRYPVIAEETGSKKVYKFSAYVARDAK
jgi:vacuolar-type H+-ATPase subunit B/Vma2